MDKKQIKNLLKEFSEEAVLDYCKSPYGPQVYDMSLKLYNDGSVDKNSLVKRYSSCDLVNRKCLSSNGRKFLRETERNDNSFFIGFNRKTNEVEYYQEMQPTVDGCLF